VSIIHRIAVVGPESCGKSTLSAQLAASMQAQGMRAAHVTEYARDYYAHRPYQVAMSDIEAIARGQLQAEQAAAQHDWLMCDTTVLTCKIWAEVAFGQASPALLQFYRPQDYVLTLLTAADIPWQPDPLRSHPLSATGCWACIRPSWRRWALFRSCCMAVNSNGCNRPGTPSGNCRMDCRFA
jgi:nicotinamide riboside kinase